MIQLFYKYNTRGREVFHIKDDKRSQTSAKMIVEALDVCLRRHPFENVSITELCAQATVSRATFYRLFDTLEDVIAYGCESFAVQLLHDMKGCKTDDIMKYFFSKWMARPELLELILRIRREDILLDCHRRNMRHIQEELQKQNRDLQMTEYHISVLTHTMIGMLTTWIRTGKQETPDEIIHAIKMVLKDLTVTMH